MPTARTHLEHEEPTESPRLVSTTTRLANRMLGNNDALDRPPSSPRALAIGEDVEPALVLKGELALRLV